LVKHMKSGPMVVMIWEGWIWWRQAKLCLGKPIQQILRQAYSWWLLY
jgi:hypothetical protein